MHINPTILFVITKQTRTLFPVVRLSSADIVVPHVSRCGRPGGRAVRGRRPGRRAMSQPRRAVRPQGEPMDKSKSLLDEFGEVLLSEAASNNALPIL